MEMQSEWFKSATPGEAIARSRASALLDAHQRELHGCDYGSLWQPPGIYFATQRKLWCWCQQCSLAIEELIL